MAGKLPSLTVERVEEDLIGAIRRLCWRRSEEEEEEEEGPRPVSPFFSILRACDP